MSKNKFSIKISKLIPCSLQDYPVIVSYFLMWLTLFHVMQYVFQVPSLQILEPNYVWRRKEHHIHIISSVFISLLLFINESFVHDLNLHDIQWFICNIGVTYLTLPVTLRRCLLFFVLHNVTNVCYSKCFLVSAIHFHSKNLSVAHFINCV